VVTSPPCAMRGPANGHCATLAVAVVRDDNDDFVVVQNDVVMMRSPDMNVISDWLAAAAQPEGLR